jgi:hypothetical protein
VNEQDQDQKQFFQDLGATAEQTVQEVRGFEENFYSVIHGMMRALPWADDFNKKMQRYIEQNFDAAFAFARELSEAKDMQDVFRIYSDYNQKYLQSIAAQVRDFAETYSNMASGAITSAPSPMTVSHGKR